MAFASATGLRISSTWSSPPRFKLRAQEAFVEIMNFGLGFSPSVLSEVSDSAMALVSSKMALYGLISTLSPRWECTSSVSLFESTYSVAVVGVIAAYEKNTGLYGILRYDELYIVKPGVRTLTRFLAD